MDELMSPENIASLALIVACGDDTPYQMGMKMMDRVVTTLRAAHEYKAEVGRLKSLRKADHEIQLRNLDIITQMDAEITRLKEQLAAHTKPATDWRSE